jgi:hypothetical protein
VGAAAARRDQRSRRAVERLLVHDRAARLRVETAGPGHLRERRRRDELAGHAIDHVEERVLVGLHDHLAGAAADRQIRQHQVLHAVEVPGVARHHLEVPFQLARVHVHGEDGAHVEIVHPHRRAQFLRPRFGVAGADVDEIELGS